MLTITIIAMLLIVGIQTIILVAYIDATFTHLLNRLNLLIQLLRDKEDNQ